MSLATLSSFAVVYGLAGVFTLFLVLNLVGLMFWQEYHRRCIDQPWNKAIDQLSAAISRADHKEAARLTKVCAEYARQSREHHRKHSKPWMMWREVFRGCERKNA